ncbi:uncharacterized protein TRIADDRAFT_53943 [Trichoplax adhaerens]|uniref:ribonuclease Z n=1 Tax=Trichoplax adhaerens TaxID=10228 RepID=B3RMG2_TRIAD|nr:hypothetical protein TRIADDRAFT_53943 [Trichoplax adhaerens]EDV27846.1 hypothetical protein TRIADDRAFT_53943 [Trichoplax adhaerens]|eukprot:XP_002109680.1 hypothetical protein TRIADDRAFT_53943 [Trichoplax adhaerens]
MAKVDKKVPNNWIITDTLLTYHFRPRSLMGFDRSKILQETNVNSIVEKINNRMDIKNAIQFSNQDILDRENRTLSVKATSPVQRNLIGRHGEIVFLGTGSCYPSKYRNVSSILLRLNKNSCMLMDCGEGTFGQLYRHYGSELSDILRQLKFIFISHMHADHHQGIVEVLLEHKRATQSTDGYYSPLYVIGPWAINKFLNEYNSYFESVQWRFMSATEFFKEVCVFSDVVKTELGIIKLKTVYADHCKGAFCIALTHREGWKLAYSGDTQPSSKFVEIGKDADVLIHEATFEDDLVDEARSRKHSTTSEAIEIGVKMNAKFTILTHFSQRYPKIPAFSENYSDRTGIAYDHMTVNSESILFLPRLLKPLNIIFKEEEEIED